jgi:hypothetical protein
VIRLYSGTLKFSHDEVLFYSPTLDKTQVTRRFKRPEKVHPIEKTICLRCGKEATTTITYGERNQLLQIKQSICIDEHVELLMIPVSLHEKRVSGI